MKKKLLCLAVGGMLALSSVFGLAACSESKGSSKKGGDSYKTPEFVPSDYPKDDAYKGALSKESYSSNEQAAQAFIEVEIAGDATNAVFKSYTKKKDLDKNDYKDISFALGENNVTAAELGEIAYEDRAVTVDARNAASGTATPGGSVATVKTKKYRVYIFQIDFSNYKYFAPELDKGDSITQSYYDEIFDKAKYSNCTITEVATGSVKYSQQRMKMQTDTVANSSIQVNEDYCYCAVEIKTQIYLNDQLQDEQVMQSVEIFNVFDDDGNITDLYVKSSAMGGEWMRTGSSMIDVREYTTPKMDNSFFVKVDYGFTVNHEKFSLFLQEAINDIAEDSGLDINMDKLDGSYDFMIKDGRLDKAVLIAKGPVTMMGIEGQYESNTTTTYSRFGTTVISVPDGIVLSVGGDDQPAPDDDMLD